MTIAAAQAATAAAAPVAEREWAAESETPPGVLSDVTARDDFTNLLVLLRYARQGCWAFALYNNTAVREQVVAALTKLLAPLPVYQWTYSPHDPYPYAYLERMPEAARAQRAVVFLFDFERAGEAIWKALDYNRELFSAHPHGLVFWVTPPGRGRAARQAPHFWAQRSGVFDFTVDRRPPVEQIRPLVGMGVSIDNLDETLRQLRLYQGLLEDLDGQPDAPPRFLADLHLQVARLAYYVDQVPLARQHAQAALPLYRAIGARLGEANCIRALGDVHVMLAEYPAARARYEAALPLYRAISDRLGEANCIRALGDVSLEQGDEDAALAAYQEAFERFMALGLPNDAASVLTSQTGIYDRRKEYDRSLPLHSQAIDLAPANPMWYRNRALCYINLKDAAHALADLETAARLQPDHPYLALRRGDVALLQKDYVAAAGHYQAFIAALPRNNAGHFGLARALFGQRRPEHALAALQQALALTYSRQDVVKAIDELVELQTDSPDLPGIDQGVALLRDWLAQRKP